MSSNACTAWASRSTTRSSATSAAQSALPHLCAGRLARNAARLSRATLAGERRQHVLRQSHRRRHVPIEALLEDPVEAARALGPVGAPHPQIALPRDIFGRERANSAGLDLSNEARLAELGEALVERDAAWRDRARRRDAPIVNPADGAILSAGRLRRSGRSRGGRRRGVARLAGLARARPARTAAILAAPRRCSKRRAATGRA